MKASRLNLTNDWVEGAKIGLLDFTFVLTLRCNAPNIEYNVMTLVDIKNILFSHFLTETIFNLNEDLASIKLEGKDLDESLVNNKHGLFKAALEDFVKSGVLANIGEGVYILAQPIDAFSQNLVLAPGVSEMVGDLINDVGVELGMVNYTANKLAITSDDIGALCQIVHLLLEEGISPSPAGSQNN